MKNRRITRDNFSAERVLREVVQDRATSDQELLRVLEEACHAYVRLRNEARELFNYARAGEFLADRNLERILWRRTDYE